MQLSPAKLRQRLLSPEARLAIEEIHRLIRQHRITPTELKLICGPAETQHRRERAAVITQCQQLIDFWGITRRELAGVKYGVEPPAPPIKYQHPLTGDAWDGRGSQPAWLRSALLKEGYLLSELAPLESGAFPAAG